MRLVQYTLVCTNNRRVLQGTELQQPRPVAHRAKSSSVHRTPERVVAKATLRYVHACSGEVYKVSHNIVAGPETPCGVLKLFDGDMHGQTERSTTSGTLGGMGNWLFIFWLSMLLYVTSPDNAS